MHRLLQFRTEIDPRGRLSDIEIEEEEWKTVLLWGISKYKTPRNESQTSPISRNIRKIAPFLINQPTDVEGTTKWMDRNDRPVQYGAACWSDLSKYPN